MDSETLGAVSENALETRVFVHGAPVEALAALATTLLSFWQSSYIRDYIWQVDAFGSLRVSREGGVAHLASLTRFGDNLDDEWFAVLLLLEASKKFPELMISVVDNDGHFLLIEAASKLPRWLKPENSAHRLWITRGAFHLIPLPRTPSELVLLPVGKDLSLQAALDIIHKQTVPTLADAGLSSVLMSRLESARTSRTLSDHFARVALPLTALHLLAAVPSLIAPAVRAYYYRDALQLRACRKMQRFPATDVSVRTVRFTRCLYAQLLRQKLDLVPAGYAPLPSAPSDHHAALELGYKLVCGLEMLYQDELRKASKSKSPFENKKGLGQGEQGKEEKEEEEEDLAHKMDAVLSLATSSSADLSALNANPSSDAWLNISPKEVEDLLAQREAEFADYFQMKKERAKKGQEKPMPEDNVFDDVIGRTRAFLNADSDYKGVEVDFGNGKDVKDEDDEDNDVANDEEFLAYFKEKFGRNVFRAPSGEEQSDSDEGDDFYGEGDDNDNDNDSEGEMGPAEAQEINAMMRAMDKELRATPGGATFSAATDQGNSNDEDDAEAENLNLIKSFLESYHAQGGDPGPVSNLMNLLMQAEQFKTKPGSKKKDE